MDAPKNILLLTTAQLQEHMPLPVGNVSEVRSVEVGGFSVVHVRRVLDLCYRRVKGSGDMW
jgi:hypothetical protein